MPGEVFAVKYCRFPADRWLCPSLWLDVLKAANALKTLYANFKIKITTLPDHFPGPETSGTECHDTP